MAARWSGLFPWLSCTFIIGANGMWWYQLPTTRGCSFAIPTCRKVWPLPSRSPAHVGTVSSNTRSVDHELRVAATCIGNDPLLSLWNAADSSQCSSSLITSLLWLPHDMAIWRGVLPVNWSACLVRALFQSSNFFVISEISVVHLICQSYEPMIQFLQDASR